MKTYIIKSNYEYEIEADSPEEALELWHENIETELADQNQLLVQELAESLYAERI